MPARSKAQQKAAGAALLRPSAGSTEVSKLKGASREMVKSMSEKELEEFASGPRKGKPERFGDRDKSEEAAPTGQILPPSGQIGLGFRGRRSPNRPRSNAPKTPA